MWGFFSWIGRGAVRFWNWITGNSSSNESISPPNEGVSKEHHIKKTGSKEITEKNPKVRNLLQKYKNHELSIMELFRSSTLFEEYIKQAGSGSISKYGFSMFFQTLLKNNGIKNDNFPLDEHEIDKVNFSSDKHIKLLEAKKGENEFDDYFYSIIDPINFGKNIKNKLSYNSLIDYAFDNKKLLLKFLNSNPEKVSKEEYLNFLLKEGYIKDKKDINLKTKKLSFSKFSKEASEIIKKNNLDVIQEEVILFDYKADIEDDETFREYLNTLGKSDTFSKKNYLKFVLNKKEYDYEELLIKSHDIELNVHKIKQLEKNSSKLESCKDVNMDGFKIKKIY